MEFMYLVFARMPGDSCRRRFSSLLLCPLSYVWVTAGSPSRGGDVTVCVWHKPAELAHSFWFFLVSVSVFMALSTVFHSINSPDNTPLSLCSFGLFSALLVLLTTNLFMKVSLSPDIILIGWLGSKHQLTNYLLMKVLISPDIIFCGGVGLKHQ